MAGFGKGLLLGGIVGTVFGLLTNKRSGRENRAQIHNWATATAADVAHLQRATKAVQASARRLQELNASTLQPATTAIKGAIQDYEFTTAANINSVKKSLGHINNSLNSDKQPKNS